MAKKLASFPGDRPSEGPRRYPWTEWADGGVWEIRRGEDYDVATENMRVNLHMRADALSRKVRTQKFKDENGEGLTFQFRPSVENKEVEMAIAEDPEGANAALELLYVDTTEIYERAREEVTIERLDGRQQKYAATRYKQQIDKGYANDELVPTVARIVRRRTTGFGHLEQARRPDLMLETLVLDTNKPYHRLFSPATVQVARERIAQYEAGFGA